MRVRRLRLEHVRGVDAIDVPFEPNGVTIIEAPNESGKSTLIDALDLVLEHKDSTRRQEVRDLAPVGRDVGSLIEAELSCGEVHLTIRKRFNKDRMTELEIHAPHHAQFSGDDAHVELRRILEATTDLALYDALRFRQGGELDVPALATSRSLAARLDEIAGGTGDPGDDALLTRVRREYERYYTPTGQDGQALRVAADELATAEAVVADLESQRASTERDVDRLLQLEREADRLAETLAELEPKLREHRRRRERVRSLREELRTREALADVAAGQEERAARDRTEREELVARVDVLRTLVAERRPALDQARAGVELHERWLDQADAEVSAAEEREHAARVSLDAARAAAELGRRRAELRDLLTRQQRIETALVAASDAEAELEARPLSDEQLARLHTAHDRLRLAESRLDDAAPVVAVRGHERIELRVDGDELTLDADGLVEASVPDRFVLDVPGVVEVEVRAGSSLAERQADVDAARDALLAACRDAGVEDVQDAERLAATRRDHERTIVERDAVIARELAGWSRAELADRIRTRTAQLRDLEARLAPADDVTPQLMFSVGDDVTPDQLAEVEARDVAARDDASQQRAERAALAQELERLRGELRLAADQLRAGDEDLAVHEQRLVDARRRASDDDLDAAHRAAIVAHRAAVEAVEDARRELEQLRADEVELLASNAEQQLGRLRSDRSAVRDELTQLRTRIELRGGEGIGEALDGAIAERERARDHHARLRRRAAAAASLKDAFETARDATYAAYREPLRERIVRAGQVVFGPSFDVRLDDGLRVVSRHLDGTTLSCDRLSAGAREQLAVLTALAAADLAGGAGGDGVPFVLDDALGFTDLERLERLGAVLGRVRGPQVIVLTCVADRFAAVGGADVVRLRELAGEASDTEGHRVA